jgi:hypothetical protein
MYNIVQIYIMVKKNFFKTDSRLTGIIFTFESEIVAQILVWYTTVEAS